jgi:hypothetical protein
MCRPRWLSADLHVARSCVVFPSALFIVTVAFLRWKKLSVDVAATLSNVPHMDKYIINTIIIVATNVTFVLEYDVTMLLVSCLIYQESQ